MLKKILFVSTITMSLYGGIFGCKYQGDLKKSDTVNNKTKFAVDNQCANVYSPSDWKRIKKDDIYTLIQSPYKGEENYKYWVITKELPAPLKKKPEQIVKKKDFKTTMEYGNLIWQDSLLNETKMMSYNEANGYCKKLNYNGINNWRLPTLSELTQICAIWEQDKPYKELKHMELHEFYWSKDTDAQFVFSSGASSPSLGHPALVRCVAPRK